MSSETEIECAERMRRIREEFRSSYEIKKIRKTVAVSSDKDLEYEKRSFKERWYIFMYGGGPRKIERSMSYEIVWDEIEYGIYDECSFIKSIPILPKMEASYNTQVDFTKTLKHHSHLIPGHPTNPKSRK